MDQSIGSDHGWIVFRQPPQSRDLRDVQDAQDRGRTIWLKGGLLLGSAFLEWTTRKSEVACQYFPRISSSSGASCLKSRMIRFRSRAGEKSVKEQKKFQIMVDSGSGFATVLPLILDL